MALKIRSENPYFARHARKGLQAEEFFRDAIEIYGRKKFSPMNLAGIGKHSRAIQSCCKRPWILSEIMTTIAR